jgi:hypothetical protein
MCKDPYSVFLDDLASRLHLFIKFDEAQDSMDLSVLLSLLLSFALAEARILTDLSDGFCRSYQFGCMP